ncbi:MAG: MerR family transcriptional regulator [Sphingomonadaceae bacterium]
MLYRPQDIAAKLGIAPSTLRLWSARFAGQLSDAARKSPNGLAMPAAQRRYTDDDLEVLLKVKSLLGQGHTYQEVEHRLRALPPPTSGRPSVDAPLPAEASHETSTSEYTQLQEALKARDKTIAALKESLQFMDAYLQAARMEREEARERARKLEKELEEIRAQAEARLRRT